MRRAALMLIGGFMLGLCGCHNTPTPKQNDQQSGIEERDEQELVEEPQENEPLTQRIRRVSPRRLIKRNK